jgi:hypothetical protein
MNVIRTSANVAGGVFTLLAVCAGIVAAYHWLYYAVVIQSTWQLSGALMWTFIAVVFFMPVWVLDRLVGGD